LGIIFTSRLLPEFQLHLNFKKETLKLVIKYSSGVVTYQILSNLLLLFERGWITAKLGPESLTYYVVPMSLAIYLHGFISSLTLVVFPLASESRSDLQKLLKIYTKATKIVCALVGFAAVTLIIESKLFLSLWISPEFAENSAQVLIFHVVTFSLIATQIIIWQLSEGLSSPGYNILVSFFYLLISVPGMIWLTNQYGIVGIAFARMFAVIMTGFTVIYAEKIFLGQTLLTFRAKILLVLFFAMILTASSENFVLQLMNPSWSALLIVGGIGAIVYFLTLFIFRYISGEEIKLFRRIIGR
jgi:O-antigen/teichoic acid export membrane protein